MVIIKYIAQINASSKGLPRTLFLLVALLFGSLLLVSCEDPNGIDTPVIDTPEETNTINGFEYVDLGLSVKWAACNVGAYAPDDYGNYYAWGETGFKTEYTRENSVTYDVEIDSIGGDPTYDVATLRYGAPWRLPTVEEVDELIANCDYKWDTVHGVTGGHLTSRINGNNIFVPGAGLRYSHELGLIGVGYYWTSTPESLVYAQTLSVGNLCASAYPLHRYFGCNIRPVVDSAAKTD